MALGTEKIKFLSNPTPLERMDELSKELGLNLFIKRDDLTNYGGGGNKLRKLEYFLKDALDKKSTMLMTVGGAQTNHGRLTATVAAKYGLKSAILSADTYPGEISANLLLDGILGCHVYLSESDCMGTPDEKLKKMREDVTKEWESRGEKVYYIPMGGSNELGMLGYYDCMTEIVQQIKEYNENTYEKKDYGISYDSNTTQNTLPKKISKPHIVVTVGSYGTYMGLLSAIANEEIDCKLTGVTIMPYYDNPAAEILKKYGELQRFYNLKADLRKEDVQHVKNAAVCDGSALFRVADEYDFGAYNNPVSEVRETIYHMARKEGIFLDPCYTGKTFNALMRLAEAGYFAEDETVIFIHTGGFPGLYTSQHRSEFEKELKEFVHLI